MQSNSPAGESWPRPAVAWYAVGILVVAFIFSFVARLILSLLVQPLKLDLGLSDSQIGLLAGPAFVLFYTLVGIPIGRWSDRYSRRTIISAGIGVWSVMTAACGVARNFWELAAARVGVGVGQAALSPAAYSMIADLFPREKLGRAVGVYQAGALFGAGLAFLFGGLVVHTVATTGGLEVPLLGSLRPWQFAFVAAGLPGLLVAVLMWTVPEPARRGPVGLPAGAPTGGAGFGDVLRYMGRHRRVYLPHFIGFALVAMPFTITATWAPEYFGRVFGYTRPQAGLTLGLILVILSPLGVYTGGWIADALQKRGFRDGTLRVGLTAALLLLPLSAAATLAPSAPLAVAIFCPFVFCASLSMAVAPAALQVITPGPFRAQVSALWMLALNLVTGLLGALGVGVVNDWLFGRDDTLGQAMALINCLCVPVAAFALWRALQPFRAAASEQAGATLAGAPLAGG